MLLCLSLNVHNAPLEVREPFAFQPDELPGLAAYLRPHLAGALVISTCQRFEIYVVPRTAMAEPCLIGLLAQYRQVDAARLTAFAEIFSDREAALHLFRVAAGLESQVLGEAQILGQVGRSLDASRDAGMVSHRLGSLVRAAIGAGRRVRAETALGRGALSVPRLAIDRAREQVGDLSERTVLVVGAGETGRLAARALDGAGRLVVANRSHARAEALAEEHGGEALPLAGLAAGLAVADLVVCCASAHRPTITRQLVATAMAQRPERPVVVVDLAVPRGVEPCVADLPGVSLITVEDVREESATHQAARRREVPAAEAIVMEELNRAWRTWVAAEAGPAVVALRERAEQVRRTELDRIHRQLGMPPEQLAAVDYVTRAIVNKLLHQPTLWLKSNPAEAHSAIREVFGVEAAS